MTCWLTFCVDPSVLVNFESMVFSGFELSVSKNGLQIKLSVAPASSKTLAARLGSSGWKQCISH